MKRSPLAGIDLSIFPRAVLLLVRNPSIILPPLLTSMVGVLMARVLTPGVVDPAGLTTGLGGLIVILIELFGLGAACVIADDAWRHGRASFDDGWTEARRRGGDILVAAIGIAFILAVAQYTALLIGPFSLALTAAAIYFLIWTIPAASVGGIPGGAAIQVSIERVRANPLPAALVAVVAVAVAFFVPAYATAIVDALVFSYAVGTSLISALIGALIRSIAFAYVALVITKTYTDTAFSRRW